MQPTQYTVGLWLIVVSCAWTLSAEACDRAQGSIEADKSKPIVIKPSEWVHSLAYSHDGKLLAIGDHNGDIRVVDALTGERRWEAAKAHAQVVAGVFFLPDGRLISCSRDGKKNVACWSLKNNRADTLVKGLANGVMAFAVSPDHKRICVALMDELQFYDLETGKLAKRISVKGTVESVAWRPCGEYLAVLATNELAVIDCRRDKLRFFSATRFVDFTGYTLVAISRDGKMVATAGEDGAVNIWEIVTGQKRATLKGDVVTLGVAFLPTSDFLLTGHRDSVRLWNAITGKEQKKWDVSARLICVSPKGNSVAWATNKDVTIVHFDEALLRDRDKNPPGGPKDVETWLSDLKSEKAEEAGKAMQRLIAQGDDALDAIAGAAWIAPEIDEELVAKWIRELDADKFAVRKHAAQELEKLGELVQEPLEKAIKSAGTEHHRQEIGRLLRTIESKLPTGEELRTHRLIEVLEHIGSPKSSEVLGRIAKGNAASSVTKEAKAAIQRLTK